jgi:hypothetical protein
MNWRISLLVCGLVLSTNSVSAQLALPGAASSPPASAPTSTPKPKKAGASAAKTGAAAKPANTAAPDPASIDGRLLQLDGRSGLLQVSGGGKTLQIDKLRLAGESVSDPAQQCVVDIVGEKPIEATSVGRPDGLERYEVDVSACPFAFDVLEGAVLVPPQITACVFKAADCQTSPGGLWGPAPDSMEKDAPAIAKGRALAEKALGKALHALEERAQSNPDAADLVRDQNGFAGARDDQCRNYVKESPLGFCAANLTVARAALLEARLEAMGLSAKTDKISTSAAVKKKKRAKPDADAAAQQAQ